MELTSIPPAVLSWRRSGGAEARSNNLRATRRPKSNWRRPAIGWRARPTARSASGQLKLLLKTMRPKQWTKNVFVGASIFDVKLFDRDPLLRTLARFILFCLISGVVYIINDMVDIDKDRQHPQKRRRLLASGALSPCFADDGGRSGRRRVRCLSARWIWSGTMLSLILYGDLALMIAYSAWLKNMVIVDVLTPPPGLCSEWSRCRRGEGERFSPWIYVCMVLLALFLATRQATPGDRAAGG